MGFFPFNFLSPKLRKYWYRSNIFLLIHTLFFIVQHCTFFVPKAADTSSIKARLCEKLSVSKNMSFCTLVLVPVVGVLLLLLCPGRAVSQRVLLLLVLLWQHAAAVVAASCRHPWQGHGPRGQLVGATGCRHWSRALSRLGHQHCSCWGVGGLGHGRHWPLGGGPSLWCHGGRREGRRRSTHLVCNT